jgi:eight-cysteine-cluster-containing protein
MRLACLLLALVACNKSSNQTPSTPATQPVVTTGGGGEDGKRQVVFPGGEPRFEGPTFKNDCAGDGDCKVGGCSSEICTAEEGVQSACVVHPDQPRDATCGCVEGACVWYRAASATPAEGGGGAAQGMPCDDGKCAAGLECVSYYGIAGPRGPKFTSCEIRCGLSAKSCPAGMSCITIADGPGQVCRPQP